MDAPGGYYGKERRLTLSCGTIKLRRPRVRDLEERFESRVLPLFAKRTREVRDLIALGGREKWRPGKADGWTIWKWCICGRTACTSKVVVSVSSGYRESTQSWSEVLRDLKERGMNPPRLVIADGHLGIWGALRNVFPEADEQRCWNHRIVNLIPKGRHKAALLMLRQIPYAETRQEAERVKGRFIGVAREDWRQRLI